MEEKNYTVSRSTDYAKCPTCGAIMEFDPLTTALKCGYCSGYMPIDITHKVKDRIYDENSEKEFERWGNVKNFTCGVCGAKSVLPDYEISPVCPFCSSSNQLKEENIEGLKPNGILPFRVDKPLAVNTYSKFIKKKWLAPNDLRKNFKVDSMHGIYVPIFTFSACTTTRYKATLGKYYTVTVGSGKQKQTVTKTRYFDVSGTYKQDFTNLQFEASGNITQKDLNKLGGFDVDNALEYDNRLLAGFSSERYTESLDSNWTKAVDSMAPIIENSIVAQYDADTVASYNADTDYFDRRYKYELVPLWKCAYKYKKKMFEFFINGRTAKAYGKAPYSPIKVGILSVIGIALATLIIYLITQCL